MNNEVRREMVNIWHRCANPLFALRAAVALARLAGLSATRRTLSRERYCPESVRVARRSFLSQRLLSPGSVATDAVAPGRLKLAVGWLEHAAEPDWTMADADREQTVSLHRWNWLLTGLTDKDNPLSRTQGLALMRSWLRRKVTVPAIAREPYSTGERIVNGVLFLSLTSPGDIPADIALAMGEMAFEVAANLEYHGHGATGNHTLNNARALFFAGLAAKVAGADALALEIVRDSLPRLVSQDGFLQEGSSHYHLLFTRWILEMLWLAERMDRQEMAALLRPFAARLVERCWFFIVLKASGGAVLPLIGDISPDFPPSWLIALPWSALALSVWRPDRLPPVPATRGWSNLWPAGAEQFDSSAPTRRLSGWQSFPSSHWHRVDANGWALIFRAESGLGNRYAGHQHGDLGGFVLFADGEPLLVDCGRNNYRLDDPLSAYGLSASAHNSVLVDGYEPQIPSAATRMPGFYRRNQVDVSRQLASNEVVVTLRHDGFSRLHGDRILHTRRWGMGPKKFWVEDFLEGRREHEIETRFHWAPGIEPTLAVNKVEIKWSQGQGTFVADRGTGDAVPPPSLEIFRARREPESAGWFSSAYGSVEPIATLVYSESRQLPLRRRYDLDFH